jgi:3'-phosphoadenosine 5'-phosphosulfate sulfotransferase (PAPS reductase)/FAD synthetase/predicted RNA-binding protein with PUA domain
VLRDRGLNNYPRIITSTIQLIMVSPPVKSHLYWCMECNVPLLGRTCGCGCKGRDIELIKPYDVRPALKADMDLLRDLLARRFGCADIPDVVLFNKTGGLDRNDQVIANGERFGWLTFDPCAKEYRFDPSFEALPFLVPRITKGIVDVTDSIERDGAMRGKRIGGKRVRVKSSLSEGGVVVRAGSLWGIGQLREGHVRIKQIGKVVPREYPESDWGAAIKANIVHLKNLERNAVRFIRQHTKDISCANVSFSGGKDSTAVLELARRAGVETVYFVDTGMEFPETLELVDRLDIPIRLHGRDFWEKAEEAGPPRKDNRWCCEQLKLQPVKDWLSGTGECVTVQGNRWYESFARAGLPAVSKNPFNPSQVNISPIRNWRALEVFLYIWWRKLPYNPLYEMGLERVGCWMCPAMLESEFDRVKRLHPDLYRRWMKFLREWFSERIDDRYITCGLWRWDNLPAKMRELAAERKIRIPKPE